MFGAIQNGIGGITAECGGVLSCATCHVYVGTDWTAKVGPVGDDEQDMLEAVAAEQRENSRLSCQITVDEELDGLVVELPDTQ
jgi:2Fe-2S ferredoxin